MGRRDCAMILYEHQRSEGGNGDVLIDHSCSQSNAPLLLSSSPSSSDAIKKSLTSHQIATILILQDNMRYVYPAVGPTGLIMMENGERTEYDWSEQYGVDRESYIQMRKVEAAHDIAAMKSYTQRMLDFHGVSLHVPDANNPNLEKWCYESRTLRVNSLESWARQIDKFVLNAMLFQAQKGTWDDFGRKPGSYVICAEEDAWKVQQRTGKASVVITPGKTPGIAHIGYKASESNASFYFMPYVPIHMFRAIQESTGKPFIGYKTRFGMLTSNPHPPGYDMVRRKPDMWKVKV